MNCANDISMDPLYRRRIPTGHASFDELYVKFFGDIPEEHNSRISQNESFEFLYQKYYDDNAEDISRQHMFDDLYVKYVDELQVFGGGDNSIDFVYTLIDNSSKVSDTTLEHRLISPQTKSNITSTSPSYQTINPREENNNPSKRIDPLIPPPITNRPQKEALILLTSPEVTKDKSNARSPRNLIKQVPGKRQTRSSTRLKSSSPKTPKINNAETGSAKVLNNHRDTIVESQTPITTSKKKLQSPIISEVAVDTSQHTDINDKNNPKETNGVKKFSLTNHFDDDSTDEDPPKKKVKLSRSKKKT